MTDQDSHPYKTTGKIIIVYILIFTYFWEKISFWVFRSPCL